MKQLDIATLVASGNILRVPEGTYKHLYVGVEGTATAAQTIALADLGVITMTKNGRPLIASVDQIGLMQFANHMGGLVGFHSAAGGAADFLIPIFCYDPAAPDNVLQVTDRDFVSISLTWGADFMGANGLASGQVSLYGDLAEGIQHYEFKYAQFNYPLAAAGTVKERIPGENFTHLIISEMDDADLSRIMVNLDGVQVHDVTRQTAINGSNFLGRLESEAAGSGLGTGEESALMTAHFPLIFNGKFSEALSDSLELTIIATGAISPEVLVTSIDFTPNEAAATDASVRANLDNKLRRKKAAGKGRAVSVYQQAITRQASSSPNVA